MNHTINNLAEKITVRLIKKIIISFSLTLDCHLIKCLFYDVGMMLYDVMFFASFLVLHDLNMVERITLLIINSIN